MYRDSSVTAAVICFPLFIANLPLAFGALQHRPISSFPIDLFGNPKFEVTFLNERPIGRKEADLWRSGLKGEDRRVETGSKGELTSAHDEAEGKAREEEAGVEWTWQDLYSGAHSILNPAGGILESLWSDPLVRREHKVGGSGYPRFVPLQLPTGPGDASTQNRLAYGEAQTFPKAVEMDRFLCALPPAVSVIPAAINKSANASMADKQDLPPDVLEVFRALDPLDGGCLYHRQGWFTYAYCHNSHIRQFREVATLPTISPPKPVEDVGFEAYDLGLSPLTLEERLHEYRLALEEAEEEMMTSKAFIPDPQDPSQEIQVAIDIQIDPSIRLQIREMEAILARINKEFSHRSLDQTESEDESYIKPTLSIHSNAQARYLVEEWEGGTVCDMTGKARKIEVEFHCGSDGVDSIVGVKEISTCQYIMTIKTPRLCSIPGFYVPSANLGPSHEIQCRRIVQDRELQTIADGHRSRTSSDRHRAPTGYRSGQPHYFESPPRTPPKHNKPKTASEADFEVIIPGIDGSPPQRIIKPAKLRKKQIPMDAEEMTPERQEELATKRLAAKKERAAERDRKEERTTLVQEIRRTVDEDWETYYFVRFARFVGYYKKGGSRERKHKEFVYKTLEEEVANLLEEETAQRKKMEM